MPDTTTRALEPDACCFIFSKDKQSDALQYGERASLAIPDILGCRGVEGNASKCIAERDVQEEEGTDQEGRDPDIGCTTTTALVQARRGRSGGYHRQYKLPASLRSYQGPIWTKTIDSGTVEGDIALCLWRWKGITPNIVQIKGIEKYSERAQIKLHTERANCNVEELLEHDEGRPNDLQGRLLLLDSFLDVGQGLAFLHEGLEDKYIVHADFRPQNVVVFRDTADRQSFKIIDFGISFLRDRGSAINLTKLEQGSDCDNRPHQGDECDYRPPEGYLKIHCEDRPDVARAYDVYAYAVFLCICMAWLWNGPEECHRFDKLRENQPFAKSNSPLNSWFYSICVGGPDRCTVHTANAAPDDLHVRLETLEGSVWAIIHRNDMVRRYFKAILDGEGRKQERQLLWRIYTILDEHCLCPNPANRSDIGQVLDLLRKEMSASRNRW